MQDPIFEAARAVLPWWAGRGATPCFALALFVSTLGIMSLVGWLAAQRTRIHEAGIHWTERARRVAPVGRSFVRTLIVLLMFPLVFGVLTEGSLDGFSGTFHGVLGESAPCSSPG